ncbi:hypothetical protein TNCV_937311 [Trichonephila clavipes]|nr:hypothetical protein TNCV_937311 [Trichonephila clavipes]
MSNKQIDEWLERGIVKTKKTPPEYASPIALVKKKDEVPSGCVCGYGELNRKLVKDRFLLPLIRGSFQRLWTKDLVISIARWALLLEEYDYEIVHRSGQRMQHVRRSEQVPSHHNYKKRYSHRKTTKSPT